MKKYSLVIILIALATFVSCKKSVEGENKQWEYAVKELNDLKITYRNFAPAIDLLIQKAEGIKKEADGISDEQKKIAKLSEANNVLSHEFVNDLKSFADKKKQLNDNILKLETSPKDENLKQSALTVVSEARMLLRSIDEQLAANVSTVEDATSITRKVSGNFKQVSDNVNSLLAKVTDASKPADPNKAADPNKPADNTTGTSCSTPASNQVAQVKCKYCGNMNDASAAKCKSCGAPVKK